MRLVIAGAIALGVVGCRDAFTAHVNVVAHAGQSELTVTRLAEIMAAAPSIPLRRDRVEFLATRWVEYSAFAQRAAQGDSLLDSALVLDVMWPHVRSAMVDSFHVLLVKDKVTVEPAQVDSAYRAGDMRFITHILRRATTEAPPEEREAQRRTAEQILAALMAGGSWDRANEMNEDSVARRRRGSVGVITRGQTVPRFENIAFALSPAGLSEVTETEFGFHLIYRPPLADVREPFSEAVAQVFAARLDSAYQRELLGEKQVEVRPSAPAAIREAAAAPLQAKSSQKVLATYDGGRFVVRDLIRWLQALPAQYHQQIGGAPDEQLVQFVQELVGQELVWEQADSAGIWLSDEDLAAIHKLYELQLARVRAGIRVYPDSLAEGESTLEERMKATELLVDSYLGRATLDPKLFVAVPAFLADHLLDDIVWEVRSAGIEQVLERARQLRAARQSSETGLNRPGQGQ